MAGDVGLINDGAQTWPKRSLGRVKRRPGRSGNALLLNIPFNGGEVGSARGTGEVGWSPEVIAPEFAPNFGEVALTEQTSGYEFERIHESGNGQFWRVLHQEVDVVILAIELQ